MTRLQKLASSVLATLRLHLPPDELRSLGAGLIDAVWAAFYPA